MTWQTLPKLSILRRNGNFSHEMQRQQQAQGEPTGEAGTGKAR
jgi:hypothetical protein